MKLTLVILACIGLLIGLGCASEQPYQGLSAQNQETSSESKEPQQPLIIIDAEPEKPINLHFESVEVKDVTTSSAVLEFSTDHPSVATITLIAWEREVNRYNEDSSDLHSIYMSGLQYSTDYTVIIEASGSPTLRKVIRFTTNPPIPISSSNYLGYFWNYYFQPSSSSVSGGSLVASWYSGDGSFSGNVWSVLSYPGETKQCVLAISNTLGYSITVSLQSNLVSYPTDGEGKVSISAESITVPNNQTVYLTVNAVVSGDAPIGLYELEFELLE